MTKKIPLGVALAFILIAVAVSVAVAVTLTMRSFNSVIADLPEREQLYDGIAEIDELVRAEYYGDIQSEVLDSGLARAYIESLPDEYSRYMTEEEYSSYKGIESGKRYGTGISGKYNSISGVIIVVSSEPGSAGSQAGIAVGDSITSVGGEEVTAENAAELIEKLSSTGKGSLDISFTHKDENGEAEAKTVSLERNYEALTVTSEINGECGSIRISDFYDLTPSQFSAALEMMKSSEINKLIIDLRGNSGGNIVSAALATDLIVPLATEGSMSIATVNRANGDTVEIFTADSATFACKVAVLVDSRTAGAAELFACDLRDYGFAVLVGEQTVGRGVMQKIFELENGDAVLLSVGKITPYTSESYDKTGLTPDIATQPDAAYEAAAAYLASY